jgi:prevent-host-death family protein
MKAIVSLDEFRKNLSDIVARVMYGDQTVLVQKHNKAGVVVMSEREYENLRNPRKRFSSQGEWEEFFKLADIIASRIPQQDRENLDTLVAEEVAALRTAKKENTNAL